jgi:hypothetical protein
MAEGESPEVPNLSIKSGWCEFASRLPGIFLATGSGIKIQDMKQARPRKSQTSECDPWAGR